MARHKRDDPALQAFWSRHVAAWMRSPFSQSEYCERHGLSRSMMWRWRKWLREDRVRAERIKIAQCRRARRPRSLSPSASAVSTSAKDAEPSVLTPVQLDIAERVVRRRRRFSDEEKRHFLKLAGQAGSSVWDVAKRYDLAPSVLFRWRKELGEGPAPFAGFVSVALADDDGTPTPGADLDKHAPPAVEEMG